MQKPATLQWLIVYFMMEIVRALQVPCHNEQHELIERQIKQTVNKKNTVSIQTDQVINRGG